MASSDCVPIRLSSSTHVPADITDAISASPFTPVRVREYVVVSLDVEAPVEVDSLASVISTLHLPEAVTLPFAVMSVCQEAKPMLKADMAATQTAAPAMTCHFLIFMDKAPLFVYCRVQKLFRNTIIVYEYC